MATVNWDPGYGKTLTIASGQADSDVLNLAGLGTAHAWAIAFRSPATLPETITVQISESPTGTFAPQQSGGVDIVLQAGEVLTIDPLIGRALRLHSGVAVGANRVFVLMGNTRR